jgi:VirE N-terminal domain
MDIKNIKISAYRNKESQRFPIEISLHEWLTTDKYKMAIEALRNASNVEEETRLKLSLPVCIPSGTFSNEMKLIQHSGLMAIDVDAKDNPAYTPALLKEKLCGFSNVLFCGYSCRGKGVWALVPIKDTTKHQEHFKAMEFVFNQMGVSIDKSCSNVNRLRFASYDTAPYFNLNAETFSLILVEEKKPKISLKSADYVQSDNVFEVFNRNADVVGLLTNNGWHFVKEKQDRIYFTRPDKAHGSISGNFHTGLRLFTTWSSSTVFEPKKAYNASQLFNILECAGDWKQTAIRLKQLNF